MPAMAAPPIPATFPLSAVNVQDAVRIPAWVADLESFRRWARSGAMPENGWFSFLNGELWVDLSMEKFFTHNQVKDAFSELSVLVRASQSGYYIPDRMLLSNSAAGLATEPDAAFAFWETMRSGKLRLLEGTAQDRFIELEGTPDMVLEILSNTSVRKDTKILRDLYWRAGVREYWLVDALQTPLRFDILRHTAAGYTEVEPVDGWLASAVLGKSFQLTQHTDPLGHPRFTLAVK